MDHIKKKRFFVELLFLAFILLAGWKLRVRSLYSAMRISEVMLLTAVLKIMPLLEFSVDDLLAAVIFMLLNQVLLQLFFLGGPGLLYIVPFIFLLLFELLVLVRGIRHMKRGYGIAVGYAVICCWGVLGVYRQWERFVLNYYLAREGEFSFAAKALYLLLCMVIISAPILMAVRCIGVFMEKRLIKLKEYSMTYTEIDRSILLVMILTLGTLTMRELVRILIRFLPADNEIRWLPFQLSEDRYDIPLLWIGFSIMMVLIQIIYIRLLVKSISVKEDLRLQEKDLRQLTEYNRELEKNMEDMRGIRHDIKNMFLTMGGFVDRSSDEEMKVFYEENIVPFTKKELQKSDLYVKLARIHNESLKSFLFYKMIQGIEQEVSIDLRIQPVDTEIFFCVGQMDFIRILGILIDNAIEEAKVCKGKVVISMKENEREYLISVGNTVRRQIRERGVTAGTTDKGLGRGNGLLIVDGLVGKYKNVLLNSFFKEEEFVQCLRIAK